LSQQVWICGSLWQLSFDQESIACAETNEDREERKLNKQKPTIRRREKRVN
jgi:hypothetical protein